VEALREQSRGASFVCDMPVCISKRGTSKMQTSHYTIAIITLYVCLRRTICFAAQYWIRVFSGSCISEHFIRLLKFSLKKNALVFADFGNMCTFASEN
jgi:hypothetical protein